MKKIIKYFIISLLLVGCASNKTNSNSKISSLDSLKGMKISVQTGTEGDDLAVEYSGKENVLGFAKFTDAILALKQGKVNATFMDELPARQILKLNDDLYILDEPISSSSYAAAFNLNNTKLKAIVDDVITNLQETNEISKYVQQFQENEEDASKMIDYNEDGTDGEFVVATEAGFAPYETRLNDKIVGSDIAIAQKIAEKLNKKLVVIDMDFDALIPALKSNKVDMVIAGMSVTEEREKEVLFSKVYFTANQVAVIKLSDKE